MVAHARLTDEVLTWDEVPLKTIFQHDEQLWIKLSDRYISLIIPTHDDAWLLASNPVVEYQSSWIFKAITEVPHQTKPNLTAFLRSRASRFLFWLIVGCLSSILSLLLLVRSLG